MVRPTLTIPFGSGLDRLSGSAVLDPSSEVDLRNAYLAAGRLELRRGLANLPGAVPFGTDVIAVEPVKKTGLSAVVLYDAPTRVVKLYSFDGASTFSLVGTLWTVDAAVAGHLPRVSIAEMYSKIIIAHEEPLFQYRGNTRVYDVTDSTLVDMKLDLDRIAPQPVKFRGVAKHLNYLVAWGYGTASEPDRPETFRISMPGDPLTFTPEHYFLVGSPSDPIIGGRSLATDTAANAGFAIGKDTEWHRLIGSDRTTFDVVPLDLSFGTLTSRSHVAHAGELFFWSLHGPRSSTGGPSRDLSIPLDLLGAAADPSATTNDRGFAWFDPAEQEVVFCFGTWAFVLHLKDAPRRWSYRSYGIELNSAGWLFPSTGTGKLNPITATIGTVTTAAPSYTPGADQPTLTVPWTLSGAAVAETVEVWVRHELFGRPGHLVRGNWLRMTTALASGLTATFAVPYYLTSFEIAIRVVAAGTPGAGFTGPPDTWPDTARATKITAGAITSFATAGIWERRSPTEHGFPFAYVGPGATEQPHPELSFVYEQSTDSGATWQPHAAGTYTSKLTGSVHQNVDRLVTVQYRLTVEGPSDSDGPTSGTSDVVLAPEPPTITSIGEDTGELLLSRDLHPIVVTPGAHGGPIEVRVRHDPDGTWSPTFTVPQGSVEAVVSLDNTGGADDVRVEAVTHITSGVEGDPGDYSETTVATASFP